MTRETGGRRMEWLDAAKGVALLMVLFSHSMRDEMRTASRMLDVLYRLCYLFQMPFFFWLTGFTYQLGHKDGAPFHTLAKRAKRQLLPWAAYTLFIYAAFFLASRIDTVRGMLESAGYAVMPVGKYLLMAVQANNPWAYHLWFVLVLFCITIIVTALDMLLGKRPAMTGGAAVAAGLAIWLVQERLELGQWWRLVNYLALYLAWFGIGMLAAYGWDKLSDISGAALCAWACLGLVYGALRALFFAGFSGNSLQVEDATLRSAAYLAAYLLLTGTMASLCLLLARLKNTARLAQLGRDSFPIYLFHQPFCCAFLGMLLYGKLHIPALVTMAACFAASLAVPFLLVQAKSRFLGG